MNRMREISERKANALNFLNSVLSTNQRPRFWALNQWEASISGPPILTHFQNQTAISAIRQPSQQSDCNLSNHTAILLYCSLNLEIAFWLLTLQYDCWDCSLIVEIAYGLLRLQSDCWDCSLIAEIAVWLLRLQSDRWDCSLILQRIAFGLHRKKYSIPRKYLESIGTWGSSGC